MTKRESIRECKRFWKQVKRSGLSKDDFLDTPEGKAWEDKAYGNDCPLCEYAGKRYEGCDVCPLKAQYSKECYALGFREDSWSDEFYAKIKGLKE